MVDRAQMIDGVLLLYYHPPFDSAPTVMEHVRAFGRHSQYPVFAVNTDCRWLGPLRGVCFRVIVLHYSLFGGDLYLIPKAYRRYLERCNDSYMIAFFQDEHRYVRKRLGFLNELGINAIYTLVSPEHHDTVYGQHTSVSKVETVLTGYVSEELLHAAEQFSLPDADRTIDVGYRGRQLPLWMGRGAQEKHEIAGSFVAHAAGLGLSLDIESTEGSRIYGDAWYRFVASCRGMLGVEAGTSFFDLDDSARERVASLLTTEPGLTLDEIERRVLHEYEGKVPYRVLSPRHFEAAAFRVCPIMYEGSYSGVLQADVHYLALRKDWSNFDDVVARFVDPDVRRRVTDRAYDDLIASGRYTYETFFQSFDAHLEDANVTRTMPEDAREQLERRLDRWGRVGRIVGHPRRHLSNAGRAGGKVLWRITHRIRGDR